MPVIAIDYTPAYEQRAGIGRYVRELVAALAQSDMKTEYRLFASGISKSDQIVSIGENFQWRTTPLPSLWLSRLWHRLSVPLPVEFIVGSVDLFHSTDFVLPPTRSSTVSVLTVHDLSFVRVPDSASPRLKSYLDSVVPCSVRCASHVLADSEATKSDLISLYNVPVEKVSVLLSGVNQQFKQVLVRGVMTTRSKYGLGSSPYILSIGTVQPRKNYGRLIQALARLRSQGYDLNLVIAGGKGWLENDIYKTLRASHMEAYVKFIGFADDADLPALYSGAICFAFPSLYEGFGLPVLEAMACGTPVITSNISSLPEVAGDAALVVDPYDVEAITHALKRVIDDSALRDRLIKAGLARAQQFTWEKSAAELMRIYTGLLA